MDGPVRCSACGRQEDQPPLTWSPQAGARGTTWLCEQCTRDNLRSIEARLDELWW
jgi:hypothetical protein